MLQSTRRYFPALITHPRPSGFARAMAALALIAITAAAAVPVLAQSLPATTASSAPDVRVGDNVFVVPDKNAKSITGWLIIRAGCADEAEGQCVGIAHYLEHLLFINRDNDHRSKVALFPDGSGNGWTNHRATVYFQRFPARSNANAENLDKLVGYFAGLLNDVRAEEAQADRERNVVLQEYQQNTGRNPFARFNIELNSALLPNEPLGQRVIGSPETIKAFTPAAARAFHARWYARNNAALVLHGPITAADVAPLVARHIAPLPEKAIPPHIWKEPQRYQADRQMLRSMSKDARQTGIYLDRIVTFEETAADRPLNDAANAIIGGFLASRLDNSPTEILVERDGLATEARLGFGRVRDGTYRASFSASPATGVAPQAVLDAARNYITELARTGLKPETVTRLKMRITNERALQNEQPAQYAQALTNWLSAHGTYDDWNRRQERHASLTTDQVNRLLRSLAADGREVAGLLLPEAAQSPSPGSSINSPSVNPETSKP